VVKSLSSVVSASMVNASGWEGGECGSHCSFGEKCSVTEEILTGEHSHEQRWWKEKERKCSI